MDIFPETWTCCFKKCGHSGSEITCRHQRVEVKTALPQGYRSDQSKYKVKWDKYGNAVFHGECWQLILKSSRARNKKNTVVQLSCEEREMVKEANKTAEYHDKLDHVTAEAKHVADLILKSEHCVAFTGAGISTSAGIGDFRGKSGKWTEESRDDVTSRLKQPEAKKLKTEDESHSDNDSSEEAGVDYELLRPTYTHEALAKLVELGHLKHIISQNADDLHLLSGVPDDKLSELHGNVFMEKCERCRCLYRRPFYVLDDEADSYFLDMEEIGHSCRKLKKHVIQCPKCGLSHRTGRKCEQKGCKGYLSDTIINFRDNLEEHILDKAYDMAQASDLMLSLGSTMTVTPACDLVEMGREPLRLVICNRQKTGMDHQCDLKHEVTSETLGSRTFGDCDLFMQEVMANILTEESLSTWENERPKRLVEYEKLRAIDSSAVAEKIEIKTE